MPAFSPFGIVLFALQAAVGYAAYRSLSGAGPAAVVVGVCVTLLGVGVLFEAGLIAALVVDLAALGLAAVARTRVDAGLTRT
ncbi:hypothetical protein FK85_04390 [Halorubrum saccharovorum]|uniref:Uncharacterized protein n=1 Tax=Halorubrum saccharovorum TaxID=2248 RepID=A0A081EV39_9EURY|nr:MULTISPECIES: hypothetical protein [Halorubrum]KDS91277.1 hypothetical protein FK85_04390 [Halorubrum saccharovorum]